MVVNLGFCQRVFVSTTRRIGYPLRLAWNRLVHGAGRAGLLALGIAAAAAALAAVIGGSLVAQDEALARALERVPPNERSVSVVYSDLGVTRNGVTREDLEPLVDRTLEGLAPGDPVRAVQLKLLRIGGQLVNAGAADDVGRFVRLTSGRLPETCTPERCEVVQLGGEGRVPSVEDLRFVKVGEGTLVSPLPFGRLPGANATRLGDSFGVAEPPFLVAEGFDEFSTLPGLEGFYRTYAWTSPLAADDVHPWEIDDFAAASARARSTLRSESLFLDLAAPVDELAAARESGQVAGERLLLVGGQAAALLLAFAILAAAGMRRDVEGVWQRLTWFGARRYQLGVLSGAETGAAALAGVVARLGTRRGGGRRPRRPRGSARRGDPAPLGARRGRARGRFVARRRRGGRAAARAALARRSARRLADHRARRGRARRSRRRAPRAGARRRERRCGRGDGNAPAPASGPCHVHLRRRVRAAARPLAAAARAHVAPFVAGHPARVALAGAESGPGGRGRDVPRRQSRTRPLRRRLPLDARRRARGAGRLRGAARLPRPGGLHAGRARRAARGCAARRVRGARR